MELKILLASTNAIKRDAITTYFKNHYPHVKTVITCVNCDGCKLPPQPIDCGMHCAMHRIKYATKNTSIPHDMVIAIESDLQKINNTFYDRSHVRIEMDDIVGYGVSKSIYCPIDVKDMESQPQIMFTNIIRGYQIIGGEFVNKKMGFDAKNWMKHTAMIDRIDQIIDSIGKAMDDLINNVNSCYDIMQSYKSYANFPKPDVMFKYFYSLFVQKNSMNNLGRVLQTKYAAYEIDAILPLESRGLVLGAVLADRLQTAMIPMQKPGKIPGESVSMAYTKEYGTDEIQAAVDLFKAILNKKKKFYRFMIVDDLVASGGSVECVQKILEFISEKYDFAYEVVILVLDEVIPLREIAMAKLKTNYDVLFRNIDVIHNKIIMLKN